MADYQREPAEDEGAQDIRCALESDVNVLISGGDDQTRASLARMIYAHSGRRAGRFVTLDHALPPWHLLDRDTLFVEEIKALTPAMQDELDRWLEGDGGRSSANSGTHTLRIISATADHQADRLAGTLGVPPKLFYRLNIIHLPLAREPQAWVM